MPEIRPSTDMRSKYNEISAYCREKGQPVFITKNGHGDLAVMAIEQYEQLAAAQSLYRLVEEGAAQIASGDGIPLENAMQKVREALANARI